MKLSFKLLFELFIILIVLKFLLIVYFQFVEYNSFNIGYSILIGLLYIILLLIPIYYIFLLKKNIEGNKELFKNLKIWEILSYFYTGILTFNTLIFIGFTIFLLANSKDNTMFAYVKVILIYIFHLINIPIIILLFHFHFYRKRILGNFNQLNYRFMNENVLNKQDFTNHQERINLCNICIYRNFDMHHGVRCNLTLEKPTFTSKCQHFEKKEGAEV